MTPRSKPSATPAVPLVVRRFRDGDFDAVVDPWRACELLVPDNDPAHDIEFCRSSPRSDLFIGEAGGRVVATAMAGHDGHRGWRRSACPRST